MENMFCYEHGAMALKVGYDNYQREIFFCEKGKHYLLEDGESRLHANVQPRKDLRERLN